MSGVGSAPWVAGVPDVVGTRCPGPGGDVGGEKDVGNCGYVGWGVCRHTGELRKSVIL